MVGGYGARLATTVLTAPREEALAPPVNASRVSSPGSLLAAASLHSSSLVVVPPTPAKGTAPG